MCPPPMVYYETEDEYRHYYERVYCQCPIITFDGIKVYFRKNQFDHCMFESSNRDNVKDIFSHRRAERIDWIKATLTDPHADLFQGWDNQKKRIDMTCRVAVVYEEFVVIIRLKRNEDNSIEKAYFITAFQADNSIGKIRSKPRWSP